MESGESRGRHHRSIPSFVNPHALGTVYKCLDRSTVNRENDRIEGGGGGHEIRFVVIYIWTRSRIRKSWIESMILRQWKKRRFFSKNYNHFSNITWKKIVICSTRLFAISKTPCVQLCQLSVPRKQTFNFGGGGGIFHPEEWKYLDQRKGREKRGKKKKGKVEK